MNDFEILNACRGCKERFIGCKEFCKLWFKREELAKKIKENKAKFKNEEYNNYTQDKIDRINKFKRSKNIHSGRTHEKD